MHGNDWQQDDIGSTGGGFSSRELIGLIPGFGHRPGLAGLAEDNALFANCLIAGVCIFQCHLFALWQASNLVPFAGAAFVHLVGLHIGV